MTDTDPLAALLHAARDVDGAWFAEEEDGSPILWIAEAGEVLADLRTAIERYDDAAEEGVRVGDPPPPADAGGLRAALEAEWYNGNIPEDAYLRLCAAAGTDPYPSALADQPASPADDLRAFIESVEYGAEDAGNSGVSMDDLWALYRRWTQDHAQPASPALDRERLTRALLPGHLFEHPGGIETCDDRDPDAAREMAAAIADAYEADR